MLQRITFAAGTLLAALILGGCATNVRFNTETPTSNITGEPVCEVPQHWKALTLEAVNTQVLTDARVVQIRIPAEWIGDALGWFVEKVGDSNSMQHFPRLTWKAFYIEPHTGEKRFFPASMLNPLTNPYLTGLITDPSIKAGQVLQVYVLSGAHTKLLTATGERPTLPDSLNCLRDVNADYSRLVPSPVLVETATAMLLESIRRHFPKPGEYEDGVIYSSSRLALSSPKVVGDIRRVTRAERTAKRGAELVVFLGSPVPTVISGVVNGVAHVSSQGGEYFGPFGERLYSPPELKAALREMTKEYNMRKRDLERKLGVPYSSDLTLYLDLERPRSGWEIGEMLALQVEEAWRVLERLKERTMSRRNQ